jgi:hypothetical protein
MGKPSREPELAGIRRRARALGVSIRTNRASKARPERTFRLIEAASGTTLQAHLVLHDIEPALSRILADRARGGKREQQERCASCNTARLGTYRWCMACGADFEPFKAAISRIERSSNAAKDVLRFCQWCGRDQSTADGGAALTRTSRGVYVCVRCARRAAVTGAVPPPLLHESMAAIRVERGAARRNARGRRAQGIASLRSVARLIGAVAGAISRRRLIRMG